MINQFLNLIVCLIYPKKEIADTTTQVFALFDTMRDKEDLNILWKKSLYGKKQK